MANIKVLLCMQEIYESVEYSELYSEADNYIVVIPEDKKGIVQELDYICNMINKVFKAALNNRGGNEASYKQMSNNFMQHCSSLMRNGQKSPEKKWLRQWTTPKLAEVFEDILHSKDKSIVYVLCKLYRFTLAKPPCVINEIVPIKIYNESYI